MAKQSCFIIMPISTPVDMEEDYLNDIDHFKHVLECFFIPAIVNAGFDPIPPISEGSSVIQADIIKNLATADLVLCDMSTWNPNVFFEFGIRTALDKPVALVADEKNPKYPFDISPMQCLRYQSSLAAWLLQDQTKELSNHIKMAFEKNHNFNPLWKAFRIEQAANLKPDKLTDKEIINVLLEQVRSLKSELRTIQSSAQIGNREISGMSGEKRKITVADLLASQQMQNQIKNIREQYDKIALADPPFKLVREWQDQMQKAQKQIERLNSAVTPIKAIQEMQEAVCRHEETLKKMGLRNSDGSKAPYQDDDELKNSKKSK